MKIVVQNGTQHGFSRKEIEAMVQLFPASWGYNVKTILLGTKNETGITIEFHQKEQSIYLAYPSLDILPSKMETIAQLLIALAIIDETGSLPKQISSSAKSHYSEKTSKLAQRCIQLVDQTKPYNSISSETKTP